MAKVIAQFALSALLNPAYLREHHRLPEHSSLRNPELHWTSFADRLDKRMQLLRNSPTRQAARTVLGSAKSFRDKWVRFYADAATELLALERTAHVSPNVVAASILLYAWDWDVPHHNPARDMLSQRTWQRMSRQLALTTKVLKALRPIAILADLRRMGVARHPRTQGSTPPAKQLLGRLTTVTVDLTLLRRDLHREVRRLQQWRGGGRHPDEKLNVLLYFLASVIQACSGRTQFERIGKLAGFALPNEKRHYFDRENVHQRVATVKETPLADEIDSAVACALDAARA